MRIKSFVRRLDIHSGDFVFCEFRVPRSAFRFTMAKIDRGANESSSRSRAWSQHGRYAEGPR